MTEVTCPYCGQPGRLRETSTHLYNGRDFGPVWECPGTCQAYIGCHKGTTTPLGRIANNELRAAKMLAHGAFDALWKRKMARGFPKHEARNAGYKWLAGQLGIPQSECHIGMMDVETCKRVREICNPFL